MQILSFISTLGLGGAIGIVLKSIFDAKIQNRKMLFEARTKAYAGITGRVFNLFQEPDIQQLPDSVKFVKLNAVFSETMLLGSRKLVEYIGDYKVKVFKFHVSLGKKDDAKAEKLHKELLVLVDKIHTQMRKDLHIDSRTLFEPTKKYSKINYPIIPSLT